MVLKLSRSCIGPEIVTEVDAVAAKEVFVPDLVDVFQVSSPCDVNLALVD